jgi:pyridinium-3,5-biscarboxylic acid mononucleotide sulfurtransferase
VKELVDSLLDRTRSLMDGSKHHIIAYSGGVDSSLVAALIHQSASSDETVHAVLGLSPAVPQEQIDLSKQVADKIGIGLEIIPTTEGNDEVYIENNGQACLACKTHLYTCLDAVVKHAGDRRLYNGTNADDLQDPTRLGLIAAENFKVKSPLSLTVKDDVRRAAKYLGLPNWNYAASPCLRSRIALGVSAIPQHLQRIEKAERFVRQSLSLDATNDMRVRLLSKNRAMVEVEPTHMDRAGSFLNAWQTHFKDQFGFASVAIRPFRSGSVATNKGSDSEEQRNSSMKLQT